MVVAVVVVMAVASYGAGVSGYLCLPQDETRMAATDNVPFNVADNGVEFSVFVGVGDRNLSFDRRHF